MNMTSGTRQSLRIYLALMGYLVLVKLVLTLLPAIFRSPAQAAVFEWKFLGLWTALGLIGVFLGERTGFPNAWNAGEKSRLLFWPAILGIAFGIASILLDAFTHWTQFVATKMHLPSIHIEFPASLLIYPGGAIIVEVVYRLFTIPLLLWLISNILLKGKHQTEVFWSLAILTSLIEPLGDIGLKQLGPVTMLSAFLLDYGVNFTQAYLFRKHGFVVSILMRVWFYLIWHVAYGLF